MHTIVEALGYTLNEDGSVIGKLGAVLSGSLTIDGYRQLRVRLPCGRYKGFYVHRLIASKYVVNDKPDKYDRVNHIDGNKSNNHASNLEWIDARGNLLHKLGYEDYASQTAEDTAARSKAKASAYYKARWAAGYRW